MKSSRVFRIIFLSTVAALATSCNLYSFMDSPSGDAQLLSAARACFDQGDIECARENYGKLSGDMNDIKLSEEAFLALYENGASMSAFMQSFGSGGSSGLTTLASFVASGAGQTKRMAIYNDAFLKWSSIQSSGTKGLVMFVTSIALAAEILAEIGGADQALQKTDLVTTPGTCDTTTCSQAASGNPCAPPSSTIPAVGAAAVTLATAATDLNVSIPTLYQLNFAIKTAVDGLQLMDAGGKFASTTDGLQTILGQANGDNGAFGLGVSITPVVGNSGGDSGNNTTGARCYLASLISKGIGN